jgi:hypothetical protein
MSSYLTRSMSSEAIQNMSSFHNDIVNTYDRYGMDLLDNLGRRNIVMSQAQEKFFSKVLGKRYDGVRNDGATGQPDIMIGALGKELECKLTSKHKSGAISFQTDHATLLQKGTLDYLYVVADRDFKKFAVLYFAGLDVGDFHNPSPGSRGKVAMIKHKAMTKCSVLMGKMINRNNLELIKINESLKKVSGTAVATKRKLLKRKTYWETIPTKYSVSLEEVSQSTT